MKVDAQKLATALGFVERFVPSKTTLIVLEHVRLRASNGALTLQGADLTAYATSKPIEVDVGEWDICVEPTRLRALVNGAAGNVDLKYDPEAKRLAVKSANGRASLRVLDGLDFPIPKIEGERIAEVTGVTWHKAIERVVWAAAEGDIRGWPNGLHIASKGGHLLIEATNGHVASRIRVKHDAPDFDTSLPPKPLTALEAINVIEVYEGATRLLCPDGTVTVMASSFTYPDIGRVFDIKPPRAIECSTAEFLAALKRTSAYKVADRKQVDVVRLDAKDGKLIVAAEVETGGDRMEVEVIAEGGIELVAFQREYVVGILSHVAAERVRIEHDGPGSQHTVREADWTAVAMPMRV